MITINTPWAQYIADGHKPLENRPLRVVNSVSFVPDTWIAIHASKTSEDKVSDEDSHIPRMSRQNMNKGSVIAVARVGSRMNSTAAIQQLPSDMYSWIDNDPSKGCIVWDVVLRLHEPYAVTSGQGTPALTESRVNLMNTKGERKTDVQIEKARNITRQRIDCANHIRRALTNHHYDVTRYVEL
jgi:hypothetical protein